jgi:hypothetical protein
VLYYRKIVLQAGSAMLNADPDQGNLLCNRGTPYLEAPSCHLEKAFEVAELDMTPTQIMDFGKTEPLLQNVFRGLQLVAQHSLATIRPRPTLLVCVYEAQKQLL